jgi:hypothetical protein
MSDDTDTSAVEEQEVSEATDKEHWPEEREWHPEDERWSQPPKAPECDREPRINYDRAKCPLMPNDDYVVLRVDKVDFTTLSGLAVASDADGTGAGSHAPILTVVRVGPEVKGYKAGDYVLTNPRNNEFALEWADPRPPHASITYIMMKEKVLIARYDHEVIEQLKCRGRYIEKLRKQRQKKIEAEKAYRESDLNPNKGREIVDATGQPVSKSGMHEEELPEGLTPPAPPV